MNHINEYKHTQAIYSSKTNDGALDLKSKKECFIIPSAIGDHLYISLLWKVKTKYRYKTAGKKTE